MKNENGRDRDGGRWKTEDLLFFVAVYDVLAGAVVDACFGFATQAKKQMARFKAPMGSSTKDRSSTHPRFLWVVARKIFAQ